jgi:malate:Na+ symporter
MSESGNSLFRKVAGFPVGPLPLALYIILLLVILLASVSTGGEERPGLPADMIGGFAIIMIMGFLLGDIGLKMPILKDIGGAAILSMFVPSVLMYYGLLNDQIVNSMTVLMREANFLYLYIAALVCGSLLGMNRTILIQGFLRLFVPLTIGTVAAVAAGVGAGLLVGYDVHRTFFFIVIPIIGGGIGEGVLPYSIALSEILGQPQEVFIPQLVPAAMLGNVTAIIFSGLLKRFGERHPQYNGQGLLVRTGDDAALLADMNKPKKVEFPMMGAGLILSCSFYIAGGLLSPIILIPGAIIMIFLAAVVRVANVMPAHLSDGAYQWYRFIAANLTWPLLVGLGVLYMPFEDVLAAVTPGYILICASTVTAMVASGFWAGKLMKMYEVEAAIVTACHSGLGGTGDVAILSASDRMGLMPFAQISTRIGGAVMIIIATILLRLTAG